MCRVVFMRDNKILETRPILPKISKEKREQIKRIIPQKLTPFLWFLYEMLRGRGKHALKLKQRVQNPFTPVFDNQTVLGMVKTVPFGGTASGSATR